MLLKRILGHGFEQVSDVANLPANTVVCPLQVEQDFELLLRTQGLPVFIIHLRVGPFIRSPFDLTKQSSSDLLVLASQLVQDVFHQVLLVIRVPLKLLRHLTQLLDRLWQELFLRLLSGHDLNHVIIGSLHL